jgi:hypothetical protein
MDSLNSKHPPGVQDAMFSFKITKSGSSTTGPRLGQLLRGGRKAIETPNYVATTSRGVVPHISHDMLERCTAVSSIYLSLEDCKCAPSPSHPGLTLRLQLLFSHRKADKPGPYFPDTSNGEGINTSQIHCSTR